MPMKQTRRVDENHQSWSCFYGLSKRSWWMQQHSQISTMKTSWNIFPLKKNKTRKKKKSVPFSGCFLHLQESEFSECQYSHSSHHLQSYTFSTAPLSLLWNGKGIFSLQMAEKALALKGRNRWFYIYAHWAIKNIRHSWESSVCPDYFSDFIICLKYSRTKVL